MNRRRFVASILALPFVRWFQKPAKAKEPERVYGFSYAHMNGADHPGSRVKWMAWPKDVAASNNASGPEANDSQQDLLSDHPRTDPK